MTNTQRDWGQFALLLIDAQKDFWTEERAENFAHFPTNVVRLLTLCRTEGIEVVHLRSSFEPDMSDWMPKYKLKGWIPCVQGTVGVETLPFALDNPGETVITKQTFDGFYNPELLRYLRQERKRFVLTAGLLTSVCVFLTTASAAQNGFLAAVVEDCCADDPHAHEHTLNRYEFVFQRTFVDCITEHYPDWLAALRELELENVTNSSSI
jgi:nicotinamidase-related amidase